MMMQLQYASDGNHARVTTSVTQDFLLQIDESYFADDFEAEQFAHWVLASIESVRRAMARAEVVESRTRAEQVDVDDDE